MSERPSLVALLALSRRTQERGFAAGASGLFACSCPLSTSQRKRICRSLRCPYFPPNLACRRRFHVARLHRLAARSARAFRPSAASARSCQLVAEQPRHSRTALPLRSCAGAQHQGSGQFRRRPCGPRRARCYAFPPKGNARSLLAETWPNPSIERTAKSTLRVLSSAAHVKR